MPKRLFICVSDIERLYGTIRSRSWCSRRYNHIKHINGLNKRQTPTIEMYCQFEDITVDQFWASLGASDRREAVAS